jgi:hypothetical protein
LAAAAVEPASAEADREGGAGRGWEGEAGAGLAPARLPAAEPLPAAGMAPAAGASSARPTITSESRAAREASSCSSRVHRALAQPHQLVQQLARQRGGAAAPLVEDDLGEGLRGHVAAGGIVDHSHRLTLAYPARDLLERDVAALLGVVELAAFVALDEPDHRCSSLLLAPRAGSPARHL